ncbi:hypothetical protein [Cellulomonas sp. Leaf334]|uniref:hypothetical protein n=1 Tax=Cellulomonas sp. Leaf334 TaxID=1736339 RepID=UPI0006FAD666|nr:hypothetical protein [Cellulomonas sp. Leaf334]KQR08432.1 hypothetical protein ASF78_19350 [Cellulomonas sp. Leaf334]
MSSLELSDRWSGLDESTDQVEASRARILAELHRELGESHELFDQVVRVEAFFEASDDVIVSLVDHTFALVHPTYSGRRETPPWPLARRLGTRAEASVAIARWECDW